MSLLLSFIIPCYNAERYVQHCLDSIFSCDLVEGEYEVLCYDDCSSDDTAKILAEVSRFHNNIKILRGDKNFGPGKGRNECLKAALGRYVWFVDADDMIVSDRVKELVERADAYELDVLAFNYEDLNETKAVLNRPKVFGNTEVLNGLDFVEKSFGDSIVYHMGYMVRFLCRRDFLMSRRIFFPEGILYGEDTVIMLKLLFRSSRVQSIDCFAYQYWHHESSTCGEFGNEYPARLIYEYCITTSIHLLSFSDEMDSLALVDDKKAYGKYARIIRQFTHAHYLGMLPIFAFRTTKCERKKIFKLMKGRDAEVKLLKREMNLVEKIFLLPVIGPIMVEFGSFVYGIGHRKKVVS